MDDKSMPNPASQKLNYVKAVSFYVSRASVQLDAFDAGQQAALFYAALELRMGIEARLHESLKSSRKVRKLPEGPIGQYRVKKLLGELARLDPDSQKPVELTLTLSTPSSPSQRFAYIPLSQSLIKAHGQIGNLLHYTVFENHPRFFMPARVGSDRMGLWTIFDYRDWLARVREELEEVSRGGLISHPIFNEIADRVFENEEETDEGSGMKRVDLKPKPSCAPDSKHLDDTNR